MAQHDPDWLNEAFVTKVLKHSENDDSIEVKKLTTKSATAKGCRKTENKSLIVKVSPMVEGPRKNLVAAAGIFDTEIEMMSTALTDMNDLLSQEGYRLSARILYTQKGDPTVIVIEDLAPLGYRMADRTAGLDLHHCRLVMRGLGKFHAASVAVVEKKPNYATTFSRGIFHDNQSEQMKSFVYDGFMNLAKEVRNWPELGVSYATKFEKLAEVGFAKAADCAKPSTIEFQVINHGDCWLNNMLFRYDDQGKPSGHIFVDFQMSVWASPAIDILYVLNTSTSLEVLLNHRDELVKEYHDTLKETMLRIGCKTQPPSLAALEKSIKKREFYGLITTCVCLPIVLTDKDDVTDLDEILSDHGSYNNPTINRPIYRNRILRLIPNWNALGLLDA